MKKTIALFTGVIISIIGIFGLSLCCLPVAAGVAGILGIIAVFAYKYNIYLLVLGGVLIAVSIFLLIRKRLCQIKKK